MKRLIFAAALVLGAGLLCAQEDGNQVVMTPSYAVTPKSSTLPDYAVQNVATAHGATVITLSQMPSHPNLLRLMVATPEGGLRSVPFTLEDNVITTSEPVGNFELLQGRTTGYVVTVFAPAGALTPTEKKLDFKWRLLPKDGPGWRPRVFSADGLTYLAFPSAELAKKAVLTPWFGTGVLTIVHIYDKFVIIQGTAPFIVTMPGDSRAVTAEHVKS